MSDGLTHTRRKLILALGAAGLAAPFGATAQSVGKVWRVGYLAYRSLSLSSADSEAGAFALRLRELGYVEGRNLAIERRSAEGQIGRLPELAAELVRSKVDVLMTSGTATALAAQKATGSIPIVFALVGDPVALGLVKSLAHPGGNLTGLTGIGAELAPKLLDLLHELAPKANRVAVITNPSNASGATVLKDVQAAAGKRGLKILSFAVNAAQEIEPAFAAMARQRAEALLVPQDGLFAQNLALIADHAIRQRLPSICGYLEYPMARGLMSFGQDQKYRYMRAAEYVDKVLKGANPAALPVEQPTRFEFIVNLATAKALSITVPQSLLLRATQVIE